MSTAAVAAPSLVLIHEMLGMVVIDLDAAL
jgi:hypothetical protein